MESIVMLVLLLVLFYFMLIRPENKRKKAAEELVPTAWVIPPRARCPLRSSDCNRSW